MAKTDFEIFIVPRGTGKMSGRIIADIFPDADSAYNNDIEKSINYELCTSGNAWHYQSETSNNALIMNAQEIGRSSGRGLWKRKNPMHPAAWRQGNFEINMLRKIIENKFKKEYMKENHITASELKLQTPTKTAHEIYSEQNASEELERNALNQSKRQYNNEVEAFDNFAKNLPANKASSIKHQAEEEEDDTLNPYLGINNIHDKKSRRVKETNKVNISKTKSVREQLLDGTFELSEKNISKKMQEDIKEEVEKNRKINKTLEKIKAGYYSQEAKEKRERSLENAAKIVSSPDFKTSVPVSKDNIKSTVVDETPPNVDKEKIKANIDDIFSDLDGLDSLDGDSVFPNPDFNDPVVANVSNDSSSNIPMEHSYNNNGLVEFNNTLDNKSNDEFDNIDLSLKLDSQKEEPESSAKIIKPKNNTPIPKL